MSRLASAAFVCLLACSTTPDAAPDANGGATANPQGGSPTLGGATSAGGSSNRGGGTSSGAANTGGSANGGSANGGTSSGGSANGGTGSGGSANGGTSNGGSPNGGSAGSTANGGSLNGGGAGVANGGSAGAAVTDPCSARPGLLFCENFEKQTVGAVPSGAMWTTSFIGSDGPQIGIDGTTAAHSGSRSLRVPAPAANFQTFAIYHDSAVLPTATGDFYLRVFIRLNRPMSGGHNAYLIADRAAMPGAGSAVRLGEMNAMLSLTVGGDANGALSNNKYYTDNLIGAHFVEQQWGCLEGYFKSSPAEIAFWLDDVPIADFHHTDWPADSYDALRFGFEKYAGPALEIWFDDIAIGTQRIGCK